jgi:hypothetical protein
MRFHGSVEFWFDVSSLDRAQELIAARAALDREDLGHGIHGKAFRY